MDECFFGRAIAKHFPGQHWCAHVGLGNRLLFFHLSIIENLCHLWDFPSCLMVKTPCSSEGGAWVQSLVGKLVSHMVCGVANPLPHQTNKQKIVPFSFFFFVLKFPIPLATYAAVSSFGLKSCLKPAEYSFLHSWDSELSSSCLEIFFLYALKHLLSWTAELGNGGEVGDTLFI